MIKDTVFYNKESSIYSEKRYPLVAKNYIQFFFKERLRLTKEALIQWAKQRQDLSLLEIGCADGIVVHDIQRTCAYIFSHIVGIDISPGMIKAAKQKFGNTGIIFKTRYEYTDERQNDVVIEIGVINYTSLTEDLAYIKAHLKTDGIAIISLAGKNSLWDKTRKSDTGFVTFDTYAAYEAEIAKTFTIEKTIPVGLPIPIIWRFPGFARIFSLGLENLLRSITPNLFHEKIYILKVK